MPVDPLAIPLVVVTHLLDVSAVARRLDRDNEFVRQLIYDGDLKALLVGRRWMVDPRDLEAYFEACRVRALEKLQGLAKGSTVKPFSRVQA